jgi:DNA-binding NarL/FixJ family response regulator
VIALVPAGFLTIADQPGCEQNGWLTAARPLLDVISTRLNEYTQRVLRYRVENLPYDSLSQREWEVLGYVGQGLTVLEMSQMMNVSQSTVKTLKRRIKDKLEIRSDSRLMRFALRILDSPSRSPEGQRGLGSETP